MGDLIELPPNLEPLPGGGVQKALDYAGSCVKDSLEDLSHDADQLAAFAKMLDVIGYARFLADRYMGLQETDHEAYIARWVDGLGQ
jgi:hypothetical protein